jgi:hypothetical protein
MPTAISGFLVSSAATPPAPGKRSALPWQGVRRTLAEIIELELFNKVWYVRGIAYDDDERDLPDDIRTGDEANREQAEAEHGHDELWKASGQATSKHGSTATSAGNGKLATLRWAFGSEWDFLDTQSGPTTPVRLPRPVIVT